MRISTRAISEVAAIMVIIVIGAVIVVGVVILLPAQSPSSQSTQSVHSTTITSNNGPSSSSSSRTAVSISTSSCSSLWSYPASFNQTFILENSTLLFPPSQTPTVFLPAHQSLFLGFHLVNQSQISGTITSSSPIDVRVIANFHGGVVFPSNSNDTTIFARTNSSSVLLGLPSPISGSVGLGNYAILFTNNEGVQANLTLVQGISVNYQSC